MSSFRKSDGFVRVMDDDCDVDKYSGVGVVRVGISAGMLVSLVRCDVGGSWISPDGGISSAYGSKPSFGLVARGS